MGTLVETENVVRRLLRAVTSRRPPGALIAALVGIFLVAGSSTLADAQTDDLWATVRMRGTTGEERVRIADASGLVVQDVTVSSSWDDYRFLLPPGSRGFRVEFRNDGLTGSGSDRNLLVDWVEVNGERTEAEAPTVLSKGVWNGNDCGEGFRQSQFLACNGWFQFDISDDGTTTTVSTTTTAPPPEESVEFAVFARGSTGSEQVALGVNGNTVATMRLGTVDEWQTADIPVDRFVDSDPNHPDNVVRFNFVNDGNEPVAGDRNVRVGSFELDGVIFNPVDLKSKGSWNGTDCGEGFRNSNWLHCNGWFELLGADDPPPPPEETVLLAANMRGTTGTEEIGFEVNGELIATADLSTQDQWFDVDVALDYFVNGEADHPDNVVRVLFMNDGYDPIAGDRNVYATAFEFNGPIYDPRDVKSKGSWNGTDCGEGFRNSNWLHCNGWFEIVGPDAPPPPPPDDFVFLDVVARGTSGSELISIEINGEIVVFDSEDGQSSQFQLGTAFTPYYFDIAPDVFVNNDPADPANVVRVLFVNDGRAGNGIDRNVYFSELAFNGQVLDPRSLKSKGTWNGTDCNEGFRNSNWLQCNGWFELFNGDGGGGGDLPGAGRTVDMGRANWSSAYVHAQIVHDLIEELGYDVTSPDLLEFDPSLGYRTMAEGDMDLWANSWYPGHLTWWDGERSDGARIGDHLTRIEGSLIPGGGLQGMLITKSWAEANNITTLDQINADEALRSQLDSDGDGLGEFYGCAIDWQCDDIMESQIAFAGWNNLEQIRQDSYDAMFDQFITKVNAGEPAVMYTWTPTGYFSEARVGDATMWLSVNESSVLDDSNPLGVDGGEDHSQRTADGTIGYSNLGADVCLSGPDGCQLGWLGSDIEVTANSTWLDDNPAAEELFNQLNIPMSDMARATGEYQQSGRSQADVEAIAAGWIANNRNLVDGWVAAAIRAG